MKKKILLISIVLLSLACGLLATPTPAPTNSGITGKVLIGPMCPVMIEGQACPDQPFQGIITVRNSKGKKIVQFQVDEQGNFTIPLAPGEYTLHPETSDGKPYPFAEDQTFTVTPGEYIRLNIQYDSGIR